MSTADEVARMLNLGGVDGSALAEVISDYFEYGEPEEDELGLFTFLYHQ